MRLTVALYLVMTLPAMAQDAPKAIPIAADVMEKQSVSKVPPTYPPIARAAHIEGRVVLRAIIGTDGTVKSLDVISGPEMLRTSAREAVSQWTYRPFLLKGKPMVVDTTITVNYQIEKETPPAVPETQENVPIANGPARIQAGVMAGQILTKVNPIYPPDARAAHVEGTVIMHAIIGKEGTIRNPSVVSGPEMLRDSAIEAVRQWTYRPYLLNGEPVEVDTTITVNYLMSPSPAPPPPPLPPGRVRVSAGVMAGQIINKVNPVFPEQAREDHIQGGVVMHAIIGKDGSIQSLQVISGPQALRNSVVEAVKQWKYRPYLLNGEPQEVETTITINFQLSE